MGGTPIGAVLILSIALVASISGTVSDGKRFDDLGCSIKFYKVKEFQNDDGSAKQFTRARRSLGNYGLRENSIRTFGHCCWAAYKLPKWSKRRGFIVFQANSKYPSPRYWGMSKGQIKSFHRTPCD